MFITPGEITLASLGVTGLISIVSASVAFLAGRRRNHAQRLWERQVELYDDVLREARRWQLDREPGAGSVGVTREDRDSTDDTRIRFVMFGDAEIGRRYGEHFNRHWMWSAANKGLTDAYSRNDQVRAGTLPPHELVADDVISRYRRIANEAKAKADESEKDLRAAVRRAVQTVPKGKGRGDADPGLELQA